MKEVSPALLRRYVERLKSPVAVIGLRAPLGWQGGERLRVGDGEVAVVECNSPLAVREQLVRHDGSDGRLVILTPLPDTELGEDVLARLAGRRLHAIEPWELVREHFGLRRIDPRLSGERWLATALLERTPPGGYPALSTGVLDRDTAWRIVLSAWLGIDLPRPDALALLRWSLDAANVARYASAPEELRTGLREWVADTAGPIGTIVIDCLAAGTGHDVLPLGIACGVVFGESDDDAVVRAQAAVRLERYTHGAPIAPVVGQRFAALAAQVTGELLRGQGLRATLPWLERADRLLEEIGAAASAHLSGVARSGFEARLMRVGAQLDAVRAARPGADLVPLEAAVSAVGAHLLAAHEPERAERARMALRLCRWLRDDAGTPAASFAAAAAAYARDGAWVDRARGALRGGDPLPQLAAAYAALVSAVEMRCEARNRRFGELAAGWAAQGGEMDTLLPIEAVLAQVAAPLAAAAPLLLVVLDGMSVPGAVELLDDLLRRGWVPLRQPGLARTAAHPSTPPVIAAFPTVTAVCRTSLLCGTLSDGAAPQEKRGFAGAAALRAATTAKHPPQLFHKAELGDANGALAAEVRAAISAVERRVIGVVLNAMDDQLAGSDQVRIRWTLDAIPLLGALLQEAQAAGRVVVLASDHGHVLERDTAFRSSGEPPDRYRTMAAPVADDEVVLRGARVLGPGGAIVAPWSERVRYSSARRNGYHGGVSPAEVVVPLAVLAAGGGVVGDWEETALDVPAWWEDTPTPVVRAAVKPPGAGRPQGELFAPAERAPAPAAAEPAWIGALLASPLFAERKARAGRRAVADDRVRSVLAALVMRGGRMTRPALAQQIGVAPLRLTGILAGMRDLLNVDGYPVFVVDEPSDTIILDRDLLFLQFDVR